MWLITRSGVAAQVGPRMTPNIYIHCNNNGGHRSRLASLVSKDSLSELDDIGLTAPFSKGSASSLQQPGQ